MQFQLTQRLSSILYKYVQYSLRERCYIPDMLGLQLVNTSFWNILCHKTNIFMLHTRLERRNDQKKKEPRSLHIELILICRNMLSHPSTMVQYSHLYSYYGLHKWTNYIFSSAAWASEIWTRGLGALELQLCTLDIYSPSGAIGVLVCYILCMFDILNLWKYAPVHHI
jgi:hypothetical protein